MAARPWTDDEDAKLRDLYAAETPVRKIAATLGRPHTTVARRATKLGLSSSRVQTAAAAQTNIIDARARRSKAALAELEILELAQARTLKTLRGEDPWRTVLRGEMGKESLEAIPTIPPRDMREESSARSAMSATISKLTIEDNGVAVAESMLEKLAGTLGIPATEEGAQ